MLRVICLLVALAGLAFGEVGGACAAPDQPAAVDLRVGAYPAMTRFVVEFSDPVEIRLFTLTAPFRVVIDMPSLTWQPRAALGARGAARGLIGAIRYAPFRPGVMRIVLQTAQPVRIRQGVVLAAQQGHLPRLILDLEPTDAGAFSRDLSRVRIAPVVMAAEELPGAPDPDARPAVATAVTVTAETERAQAPASSVADPAGARDTSPVGARDTSVATPQTQPVTAPAAAPANPAPRSLVPAVLTAPAGSNPAARVTPVTMMVPSTADVRPKPSDQGQDKPLIAIDPGHGGVDPGAHGVLGVNEKVITLATARVLRDALRASGRYRVFMTRDSDVFLPLRQRVAHARAAGAALFISLHADSIHNREVRGMSIYSLSDKASDREADTLAQRENRADALGGINLAAENDQVASILIDLARRDTRNQSRRLAANLVNAVRGAVRLLPKPQRAAGLAVLTAADVPSVLIEMGYLSNAADARLLSMPDHQRQFADALLRGIDSFFAPRSRTRRY